MKCAIELNGASFTPESLQQIKKLQSDGNAELLQQLEIINKTIAYLSKRLFGRTPMPETDEHEHLTLIISDLSFMADHFKNLQKP